MKIINEQYFGPQYKGDNQFTRKARFHQSWYRYVVQDDPKCGVGPTVNSNDTYGNFLVDGENSGKNFLLPSTFDYAKARVEKKEKGETIDRYRLFNNMLSSQPLCFNLFHPILDIWSRDKLAGDHIIASIFQDLPVARITDIKIEFAPSPQQTYLNDKTAFDAAIFFKDAEECNYLIAVEVKYVEALGSNPPSNPLKHIDFARSSGLFNTPGLEQIETCCSQVFRNFLLMEKYRHVHQLKDAFSIVIAPSENPFTQSELSKLMNGLLEKYRYKVGYYSLEHVVEEIKRSCAGNEQLKWIKDFEMRYLGFTESEKFRTKNII